MMSSNHDEYCSPKAVTDMRLFEVDEDKLIENLEALRTPMSLLPILSAAHVTADTTTTESLSLPPLNALSVCSSANNDDSSSVSSVSLDDDTWDTPAAAPLVQKRCIFPSYWEKKGGRPQQALAPPSRATTQGPKSDMSCSAGDHSYEHLLEKNETPGVRRESNASSCGSARRRLWGDNHYVAQSVPSLVQYLDQQPIRKTQSAPVVGPRRSSLRKGRFSGSSDTVSRRSSDASVSFSDEVQVKYLRQTSENWAAKGWSKQFM